MPLKSERQLSFPPSLLLGCQPSLAMVLKLLILIVKSDTHGSQDNQFVARSSLVDLLVEGKSSQARLI